MEDKPRIVFFGTPGIAVASLEALLSEGFPVAAVVTSPDRPAGRGLKMKPSPVKEFAVSHGLPLLQPDDLRDPSFLEHLRLISPELAVVVAFRMLPEEVWMLPRLGTFNLHTSLLPQYRGAAPVNWALINGETETGVTTFLLDRKMDTGKILLQEKVPVLPDETAGELLERLSETGAGIVAKTACLLASGEAAPKAQEIIVVPGSLLKKAPKIFPDDCRIDWGHDVIAIYNLIRGLSPVPGAFTKLSIDKGDELHLKIYRSLYEIKEHNDPVGKILTDGKSFLRIAAKNGYVQPTVVQPAGKKVMETGEFLHGFGRHLL